MVVGNRRQHQHRKTSAELVQTWQAFGKPWLEKHRNLKSLLDTRFCNAALYLLLGDKNKARQTVFAGLLNRFGDADVRLEWPLRHGLIDEPAAARITEVWNWTTEAFEKAVKEERARLHG